MDRPYNYLRHYMFKVDTKLFVSLTQKSSVLILRTKELILDFNYSMFVAHCQFQLILSTKKLILDFNYSMFVAHCQFQQNQCQYTCIIINPLCDYMVVSQDFSCDNQVKFNTINNRFPKSTIVTKLFVWEAFRNHTLKKSNRITCS